MKRSRFATCAVSGAILLSAATSAFAWDSPGHMAVAGIAYDSLTVAEQQRLVVLIDSHFDIARLKTDLNTDNPSPRDLVMAAATWPDLIKLDSTHFKDNGYGEVGPIVTVTSSNLMHKGWHFVDTPISRDGGATALPPAPDANTVDAATVLEVLDRQLLSTEAESEKAYDVVWMLHLVGDLHQPLHCVTGVDGNYPTGDVGGNSIDVRTQGETELHAYWDDILGKSAPHENLSADIVSANHIIAGLNTVVLPADMDSLEPNAWVTDCVDIAKRDVYLIPNPQTLNITTKAQNGSVVETFTLDGNYRATATADAQQQIKVAGYRLGRMLAPILDRP
jgi:hypothetical protein